MSKDTATITFGLDDDLTIVRTSDEDWLYHAMETTRGCHIEAERRLLGYASLTNHANLYYGCLAALLTILSLNSCYAYLALPAACFATSVALWAAFASAEKFELRARDFYASYIELQQLLGRFERDQALNGGKLDANERFELLEAYGRILRTTENHTQNDYFNYRYGRLDKEEKIYKKRSTDAHCKDYSRITRAHKVEQIRKVILWILIFVVIPAALLLFPRIVEYIHGWL